MKNPEHFLAEMEGVVSGFAADLVDQAPLADVDGPWITSDKRLKGANLRSGSGAERRRLARPALSRGEQDRVETWSSRLQTLVATLGAFDPVAAQVWLENDLKTLPAPASRTKSESAPLDDPDARIAAVCLARLSNLCTQQPGGVSRWFLRAAARRERLEALAAQNDRPGLERLLESAAPLADPADPFTRALHGALRGRMPSAWLLRTDALTVTLAALEFASPTFEHAPDPSILRRRVLGRELARPISLRSNPVSRWLTFGAVMRPSAGRIVTLAMSGGSEQLRSEWLQGLRAVYFGDPRRSVAYLDFRRPTLQGTTAGLVEELAIQFLQQERGEDYRPSMEADVAENAVRAACRRSRDLVILCDYYDQVGDMRSAAATLHGLTDLVSEARWRFVLAVEKLPEDWGDLPPSAFTDLNALSLGNRLRPDANPVA